MYKKIFGIVLGIVSFLSFVLLAFAFRDFSLLLLIQFTLTLVGFCLAQYLLTHKKILKREKLEDDETDLQGRFCVTRR